MHDKSVVTFFVLSYCLFSHDIFDPLAFKMNTVINA